MPTAQTDPETPDDMRTLSSGSIKPERGVFIAPWLGPNGETVLVSLTKERRQIELRYVAAGMNHVLAADEMWEHVEDVDPEPFLRAI
jgi:hypothetical protein